MYVRERAIFSFSTKTRDHLINQKIGPPNKESTLWRNTSHSLARQIIRLHVTHVPKHLFVCKDTRRTLAARTRLVPGLAQRVVTDSFSCAEVWKSNQM